jgi:signal transduction histidine kinase
VNGRPLSPRQLVLLDALGAVVFAGLLVTLPVGHPWQFHPRWLMLGLLAATTLPLAARRVWPRPVFALVLVSSSISWGLGAAGDSFVGAAAALYVVALTTTRPPRWARPVLGGVAGLGVLVAAGAGVPDSSPGRRFGPLILGATLLAGAWTLGRAVRDRRAYAAAAAEQRALRAVTDERLRIARELHDVTTHSMGLIAVKAAVANHVADTRPDEVRDALRVIEETSRSALAELRNALHVLRSESLSDLPALVSRAATAGVRVALTVPPVEVPGALQPVVYRIVQEALTNVMKHAAPCAAAVTVACTDVVRVSVVNDGAPAASAASFVEGHGLRGMRERVTQVGGALVAGPRAGGRFAVTATLPLEPA